MPGSDEFEPEGLFDRFFETLRETRRKRRIEDQDKAFNAGRSYEMWARLELSRHSAGRRELQAEIEAGLAWEKRQYPGCE